MSACICQYCSYFRLTARASFARYAKAPSTAPRNSGPTFISSKIAVPAPATNSGISLGVRYNGSLTDFVNENPEEYFEGDLTNARHSTIMATIGFTFNR